MGKISLTYPHPTSFPPFRLWVTRPLWPGRRQLYSGHYLLPPHYPFPLQGCSRAAPISVGRGQVGWGVYSLLPGWLWLCSVATTNTTCMAVSRVGSTRLQNLNFFKWVDPTQLTVVQCLQCQRNTAIASQGVEGIPHTLPTPSLH